MFRSLSDLWPYVLPYLAFMVIADVESRLGPEAVAWLLPLRVAVPGLLLLYFARRGAYPELRGFALHPSRLLADVGVGLAIAAIWLLPYLAGWLAREGTPFEKGAYGPDAVPVALGLRLVGFALVTPFMEELFVRSLLHRLAQAWAQGAADFRSLPVGVYSTAGFVFTCVWFTFSHASWEWPVAAACGVLFNLWLYARGHLGATIVAHAVANGAIWLAAVAGPVELWDFL